MISPPHASAQKRSEGAKVTFQMVQLPRELPRPAAATYDGLPSSSVPHCTWFLACS
jgi:hypothetical protein